MGKETKIGLTVIGLLLGVFGLVVYFKVFRPAPGPNPEAVASALINKQSAAAVAGSESLESGPKVQLSAGADEQAPVEFATSDVAPLGNEAAAQGAAAARGAEPNDWPEHAPSSRRRYADPAATEPVGNAFTENAPESAGSTLAEEASDNAGGSRFGGLADSSDATEPEATQVPEETADAGHDWATEPAAAESDLTADANADAADAVQAEPPVELQPQEPVHFAPSPVVAVPGRAIQAAAEEVVQEPPATVEQPPISDDDRYGRAAAPAYRARESEIPADAPPAADEPSPAMAPTQRGRTNAFERQNAPSPAPAQGNFERPDQSYTIEPNDNYWRISQQLYGSGAYFKALFEHNRKQYPRADRLRPGDVISAPPIDVLEKTYPDLCPRPQHRQVEQKMRAVSGRRLPRGGQVYVVEEGDTLFDIAKYELGQADRWGELYELNRDVLGQQGDHLKPGLELLLPSKVQRESVAGEPGNAVR